MAAENDWIFITRDTLDAAKAIAFVTCPEAGGVDVFIGTTRAEKHPVHGNLLALDYAVYESMALSEMKKLAGAARTKWPVCRLAILHRVGRVEIAQASVIIAVSCGHRAAAFEACRYLIDELKKT